MRMNTIASLAAASLGMVGVSALPAASSSYTGEYKRATRRYHRGSGFDPYFNRHTGQPHEHKREIARRLRQMKEA